MNCKDFQPVPVFCRSARNQQDWPSTVSLRAALPLVLAGLVLAACHSAGSAQLRVVGVQQAAPSDHAVLHVQVLNKTHKAMRLQRLEYTFAGAGHAIALERREIEPGAAVVVEVPVDFGASPRHGNTLKGRLFAELDDITQSFSVSAKVETPSEPVLVEPKATEPDSDASETDTEIDPVPAAGDAAGA